MIISFWKQSRKHGRLPNTSRFLASMVIFTCGLARFYFGWESYQKRYIPLKKLSAHSNLLVRMDVQQMPSRPLGFYIYTRVHIQMHTKDTRLQQIYMPVL